jgi:hypothetical protein
MIIIEKKGLRDSHTEQGGVFLQIKGVASRDWALPMGIWDRRPADGFMLKS